MLPDGALPRRDEPQLPTAKAAVNHFEVVDANLGFSFGVPCVEVWEAVIVEEHCDRDPEEAAYRWHRASSPPTNSAQPRLRQRPRSAKC